MEIDDAAVVLAIYQKGFLSGDASFESDAPEWKGWDNSHLDACRVVAENDESLLGWAELSPVSSRFVYGGVAEVSVYVSPEVKGRGIGRKLLEQLIVSSEGEGYWTLQAGVFPENINSLKLHANLGFRRVGLRERLGKMNHGPLKGNWRDVILLERRSMKAGV